MRDSALPSSESSPHTPGGAAHEDSALSDASPSIPLPPVAESRPVTRVLWGEEVVDDLAWLRNADDPDVIEHLKAENDYTDAVLAPVAELQERLYEEIKSRVKETDLSVPVVDGEWAYYVRTEEGLAYPIHCRRRAVDGAPDDDGPEVVMLDENLEAAEAEFFDVGPMDVSPDHRLLLWGWDTTGDERYTATIRDLDSGRDRGDRLVDITPSTAWSVDNRTVFYVRPDETNRPYQVWRHQLGTDQADDELVFTETDERFFVGVGLEKDRSFIQIGVSSKVTDEVWVIPADAPRSAPRLIAARRQGLEYSVAHHHDRFVVLTNRDGAQNFKVMVAPEADPGPDNWTDLDIESAPETIGPVMISDVDVAADHLVLFERANGQTRIRVRRWADGSITEIRQPEAVATVWPGANPDFETRHLRYGYSSMVTPASLFSVDLATSERTLLKQQEVLGGYDASRYATERLWVTAADGTQIPLSIVYPAGRHPDRAAEPGPCVLYGYGAYEVSIDPAFSAARLSLLDRGFSFAIAHVRGGGEMGRGWYLDGKFEHKDNTFDDVISCAHHLIDEGWTSPDQLVVRGGSAGGLLVGAVINRAPELFAAAVAQVPFVDALNTMLDASLPLTVTEWEEWGNPGADEDIYHIMAGYAPYENVRSVAYPSVMATAGLHDTRVGFWEPAKWVQALRRHDVDGRGVLLWTDLGAGHGGPTGRYDAWREEARILAYMLWALGLTT